MSFTLSGDKPVLVTINGRLNNQMIINRIWYAYKGPVPNVDFHNSQFWLTSFRTAFRAQILASFYSGYTVFSYELKELDTVTQIGATVPSKWKNTFNVDGVDLLLGTGADIGALAPGVNPLLPAANAMRIYLKPLNRALGFFKSNYLRTQGGWPDTILSATNHDEWAAATITAYDLAWGGFNATPIFGLAAPVNVGYLPAVWSINYAGRVIKLAGRDMRDAAQVVLTMTTNKFVGTQTTRRYNPDGTFRGK